MRCRLEKNNYLHEVFRIMEKALETHDFSEFLSYVSENCVFEVQGLYEPVAGYDAIADYLCEKGEGMVFNQGYSPAYVVELVGRKNQEKDTLAEQIFESGKLCLLMEEETSTEADPLLVNVEVDEADKITRISVCTAKTFKYREFYTYVDLCPAKDDKDYEEAKVKVSESYYCELYFFLNCVGAQFDEYDDVTIPMEKWIRAMQLWEKYAESDNFDQALEEIAGIDYANNRVEHPELAKCLCDRRKEMWLDRKTNKAMVDGLIEWISKYKDSCDCVKSYGW